MIMSSLKGTPHAHSAADPAVTQKPAAEPLLSKPVLYKNQVLVLFYHNLQADPTDGSKPEALTASLFRDQMKNLKDGGYNVITMEQLVNFELNNKPVPANSVVITFDDGYESFYNVAYPILKEFGMTASVFIIGFSSDVFDPNALPHLSWDEMRELKENGMGIYNHTYNMHREVAINAKGTLQPALPNNIFLTNKKRVETAKEYDKRLISDLTFMEKRLDEELGESPFRLLAFPYGAYNDKAIKAADQVGFSLYFNIKSGFNVPGQRVINRINAGDAGFTGKQLMKILKPYNQPGLFGKSYVEAVEISVTGVYKKIWQGA